VKPEVDGICRQVSGTLEPAPLRHLSGEIPQSRAIPANLNVSGSVNHHLNRAFAPIVVTRTRYDRPVLESLGAERRHSHYR
jgi:hypothetical protein